MKEAEFCPEYIDQIAWATWLSYRKREKRKPVTELAAKRQWEALRLLTPQQQCQCIDHSIRNDYQGLFPEKFRAPVRLDRSQSTRERTLHEDLTDRSWAT